MLEYKGELISSKEASRRHLQYATEKKGCFIYEIIYDEVPRKGKSFYYFSWFGSC